MTGTVHSFDPSLDTGFISDASGNLIFFHRSQCRTEIVLGQEVSFTIGASSIGDCAENIERV